MMQFRQFIEISEEEAKKARELAVKRGPVLDHLFKGKDRLFFPLPPDRELYKLKTILEKIPHPRNPEMSKYRISINDLRMGVVRLLQKKKDPRTNIESLSDKNTTTLGRVLGDERNNKDIINGDFEDNWNDIQPYWVVVSRHPIDVKRMADFAHLQSCHSVGGQYYHCTDQEVEGGGAVAYLITAKDFNSVDQNADEIFQDKGFKSAEMSGEHIPGRGIEGINPIARTRVRRAINNKTNQEIGVVERDVYGIDEESRLAKRFIYALRQWVTTKQPDSVANDRHLELQGGEYTDNEPYNLHKLQYAKNPSYINRFLEKISKLNDDEQIQKELEEFAGKKMHSITRMGGKKIWVIANTPRSPKLLFQNTWLDIYLSNSLNSFLDYEVIKKLTKQTDINEIKQFEKFVINMANRSTEGKIIKMENGWAFVIPASKWIDRQHSSDVLEIRQLAYNSINKNAFKMKLDKLSPIFHNTDPNADWQVGQIVFHPKLGKGVIVQGADIPGHNIQVKWTNDSLNYVDPNMIYRTSEEALNNK